MFLTLFFVFLLVAISTAATPVPGTILVKLLPDNQVTSGTYRPSTSVHYLVRFDEVPINDNVHIGVEIRGTNPAGGPRGYIAMARGVTSIKEFVKETNNRVEFQLSPSEVFAGYSWFLRPFVFYANESMPSTNMMNSGGSELFTVLKQ
jgi:hypothetical protein